MPTRAECCATAVLVASSTLVYRAHLCQKIPNRTFAHTHTTLSCALHVMADIPGARAMRAIRRQLWRCSRARAYTHASTVAQRRPTMHRDAPRRTETPSHSTDTQIQHQFQTVCVCACVCVCRVVAGRRCASSRRRCRTITPGRGAQAKSTMHTICVYVCLSLCAPPSRPFGGRLRQLLTQNLR